MGLDGTAQAASCPLGHGPRLDRRRLMHGAVAALLIAAMGGTYTSTVARAAGVARHPNALPRAATSRVPTNVPQAGACLEASLHVVMH
jgi:hypothetical protein